jgi:hypothetical protein
VRPPSSRQRRQREDRDATGGAAGHTDVDDDGAWPLAEAVYVVDMVIKGDAMCEPAWGAMVMATKHGKHPRTRTRLVEAGALAAAVATLTRSDIDEKTVWTCMFALTTITNCVDSLGPGGRTDKVHAACLAAAVDSRLLRAVAVSMHRFPHPDGIATMGCKILQHVGLLMSDRVMAAVADAGAVDALLCVMHRDAADATLQFDACTALFVLLTSWPTDLDARRCTEITATVLSAMQLHPDDSRVHEYACAALMVIAMDRDNHKAMSGAARTAGRTSGGGGGGSGGVVAMLVESMRRHPTNSCQQGYAMDALASLATGDDMQAAVIRAGGAAVIVAAMKRHIDTSELQRRGCTVMVALLSTGGDGVASASQEALVRAGAIDAVVAAMRRHVRNEAVQWTGCCALAKLAANHEANQAAIARAGGVDSVLDAMRRHRTVAIVIKEALRAIAALASDSDACRQAVVRGGGIALLLTAMRDHIDDIHAQAYGGLAMSQLGKNPAIHATMIRAGGPDATGAAVRRHAAHLASSVGLKL